MRKRLLPLVSTALLTALLTGCGDGINDPGVAGPVKPSLYNRGVFENKQRLAGEDHPLPSPYLGGFSEFGHQLHDAFTAPFARIGRYFSHNTPALAARQMVDPGSADNRRAGTLKLASYAFARKGPALRVYAHQATDDDYTVRAAGLRALNRSRATGYTDLYLRDLGDDQPLVRLEAADCLGNIPDAAAIPVLIDHLKSDVSPDVRIACAEALRNFNTTEVTKALVDTLDGKDFSVAWQARQSLALLTGQDFRYNRNAWLDYLSRNSG